MAIAPPIKNMMSANTRYIVPMSLWFVANSQRPMPAGAWLWSCPSWACASACAICRNSNNNGYSDAVVAAVAVAAGAEACC